MEVDEAAFRLAWEKLRRFMIEEPELPYKKFVETYEASKVPATEQPVERTRPKYIIGTDPASYGNVYCNGEKIVTNDGHGIPCALFDLIEAANCSTEREAVTQWQPIETAPEDGTWILLSGGKTDEDDYKAELGCDILRPVVGRWHEEFWAICYWDGLWRTGYDSPTHWKPLQQPRQSRRG